VIVTFELVESSVEVVHIGLVMFFVMGLKQFAADDWFKGSISELEFRECNLFGSLSGESSHNVARNHS